jgi:hypothetical protein
LSDVLLGVFFVFSIEPGVIVTLLKFYFYTYFPLSLNPLGDIIALLILFLTILFLLSDLPMLLEATIVVYGLSEPLDVLLSYLI